MRKFDCSSFVIRQINDGRKSIRIRFIQQILQVMSENTSREIYEPAALH